MKSNRWIKRGCAALGLCVILALAALLPALAASRETQPAASPSAAEAAAETAAEAGSPQTVKTSSSGEADKSETVYVQAEADGSVREITVEEVLKNPGGDGDIPDFSNLTGIKNTEGDESFTEQNGALLWENHGEDIRYEGKSDAQLPVTVSVSYYLDGVKTEPEALAGQSGRVRIRFDYENHTSERVSVDGEELEVCVPFAALSAVVLPEETFANIEVTNGKLLAMDGQSVAVGLAFPGLAQALRLEDYEPAEDMDLPDYVEITADVTDFELDFTATILSPGLFSDLEEDGLDDLDELIDDMASLTDASGELADGAGALSDGVGQFKSYLSQYLAGAGALNDGAAALTEGLAALNAQKDALEEGCTQLQSGLEQLDAALSQLSLPGGDGSSEAGAAAGALKDDLQALGSALSAVQEALGQLQAYQAQAAAQITAASGELGGVDVSAAAQQAVQSALENTGLTEEQKAEILAAVAADSALASAQARVSAAQDALVGIPALSVPDLSGSVAAITDAAGDLQAQLALLGGYADSLDGMGAALDALKSGVSQLAAGSRQLTAGITAYNQGVQQLYDGAAALSGGTSQLAQAGDALGSGFDAVAEGARALAGGMEAFDEEGIQALGELAGDGLAALSSRIRALREADGRYTNFGGILDGMTGSVRFIIETGEIAR